MPNVIYHHEDWQAAPFLDFMAGLCLPARGVALPPLQDAVGTLPASINQGRWVVECPNGDGVAVCPSRDIPYFVCWVCGSPENGGNWYRVVYPRGKSEIEAELMKRAATNGWYAASRNWVPGESLSILRRQTAQAGD